MFHVKHTWSIGCTLFPGGLRVSGRCLYDSACLLCSPLRSQAALSPSPGHIVGGPGWINSDYYEITAKPERVASREMMLGPMMQVLLEERFKLKLHRENREVPVYSLTAPKESFKLHPLPEGSCTAPDPMKPAEPLPGEKPRCKSDFNLASKMADGGLSFTLSATEVTFTELCSSFLSAILDRPVRDDTGTAGRFNFHLEFAASEATPGLLRSRGADSSLETPNPRSPSLFTALQETLGLKVATGKGSREFRVIDSIQRPTAN